MLGSIGTVGLVAAVLVVALTIVLTMLARRRPVRPLALELDLAKVETIEQASIQILQAMSDWIPYRAAFAYWRTTDGTRYRLRGVLEPQASPSIGPAYSGVASDASSPVGTVIPITDVPSTVTIMGPKKERWLWIPVPAANFAVRVLLSRRAAVPGTLRRRMELSVVRHTPLLFAIGQWLTAQESVQRLRRLAAASRTTLDTGTQLDGALELLLKIGGRILGAKTQFALVDSPDGHIQLSDTENGLSWAKRALSGGAFSDFLIIEPDPDLILLGTRSAQGIVACARVPILTGESVLGCFYLLLESGNPLSTFEMAALRALGQRAAQVIGGQQHMREAARYYVGTLEALVQAMDALAPTSIGHSDRCARYAQLIAEEMGFADRPLEDIVLAARLHDVGMIAVDARLVLKPDQFTVDEFELMKGHAELGGQLLQSLPQGPAIAQMVASHHERWDGAGYPIGLSGNDIPMGARIIAAVEYFDAKTSGRSYRPPVPYNVAVEDLRKASGTALDSQVVDAFLRVLETERGQAAPTLPPAPCWLLKAVPEHVCAGCRNRTEHPIRCWESPENFCTRHGDKCETCIVYTEAVGRHLVQR